MERLKYVYLLILTLALGLIMTACSGNVDNGHVASFKMELVSEVMDLVREDYDVAISDFTYDLRSWEDEEDIARPGDLAARERVILRGQLKGLASDSKPIEKIEACYDCKKDEIIYIDILEKL